MRLLCCYNDEEQSRRYSYFETNPLQTLVFKICIAVEKANASGLVDRGRQYIFFRDTLTIVLEMSSSNLRKA